MARGRATIKGVSHVRLFLLAMLSFFISRLFEGHIEILNYAFAFIGFLLFALCFLKYRSRKR